MSDALNFIPKGTKEVLDDSVLKDLQSKVTMLVNLEKKIEIQEDKLSDLKKEKKMFSEEEIPNLLQQYGLSEIKLKSGDKVIVKEDVSVTIKNELLFHKFLRERGHDDIIKTGFSFGKLTTEQYTSLADAIDSVGLDYEAKDTVAAPTKKKYFKELLGFGDTQQEMSIEELPEWSKAFVIKKTKIKQK